MNKKTKNCQNCKTEFEITKQDKEFYQKIDVPEPTFCPSCRAQRRLAFRNGRVLYKRKIENSKEEVFSCISPKSPFKVHDQTYWWSDEMDAMKYGKDYNFNKPFFEQLKELMIQVGMPHKLELETVNSPYCNNVGYLKDCYLMFNAGSSENCAYGVNTNFCNDCYDNLDIAKCELCYDGFMLAGCYNTHYSLNCADCQDVYFSKNLINCQNCFGCVNLKHKKYHIFNKKYSKKEYLEKIKEFNLGSYKNLLALKEKSLKFWLKYPVKFMHGRKNVDVTGEDIYNSKNVLDSYGVKDCENVKYSQLILFWPSKDCLDITISGGELCYEMAETGAYKANFSWLNMPKNPKAQQAGFYEMEYAIGNNSCHHIFGCVGLRNKEYCILNKQYTKEGYEELIPKIKRHMNKMPYIDKNKRVYKYGEFLPAEFSPFGYNETIANEYFPFSEDKAKKQGFNWYENPKAEYKDTIKSKDLPDNIKDIDNSILKEVIKCENKECSGSGVFRLIPGELEFYKKSGIPIPRLCPDCRHEQRIKLRNPMKLHSRKCMKKGCNIEFQTTYSPDRKEIVYCEKCYQEEIE